MNDCNVVHCPTHGSRMIQLFTSFVCDECDPRIESTETLEHEIDVTSSGTTRISFPYVAAEIEIARLTGLLGVEHRDPKHLLFDLNAKPMFSYQGSSLKIMLFFLSSTSSAGFLWRDSHWKQLGKGFNPALGTATTKIEDAIKAGMQYPSGHHGNSRIAVFTYP